MLTGQMKTSHFWLMLLATLLGATMASGLLQGSATALQAMGIVQTVLAAFGYQYAAKWQAPVGEPAPIIPIESAKKDQGRISGFALLVLASFSLFVGVLLFSGCAAMKKAAVDMEKCALGQVPAALADAVETAELNMMSNPAWTTFAANSLEKMGSDAAICVVQAALHDYEAYAASQHGQVDQTLVDAHGRGAKWLKLHRVGHSEMHVVEPAKEVRQTISQKASSLVSY